MSSFDVIVPCYRYGHFLRECVESVLSQSLKNVRVLIIDDASPDNTAEVAVDLTTKDRRVTFVRHIRNKGHIATYNEGIEWVSADYMLLLSADDYLLPGALGRAADLMDANPEVGLTFGNAIFVDERGDISYTNTLCGSAYKEGSHVLTGLEFIQLSGGRNIVPTPTAAVRSELQKRLGGYRPELPHAGDMEMWLRLAAHGSVGVVSACQAVYRRHAENMSLHYTLKTWLPDLKQRKAAFDSFFQTCSYTLPSAERLHRKLFFLLSREAVGYASAAFNERKTEISEQLSDYAIELCPKIRRSLPWIKLSCKRCMGYRAWRVLQPLVACIRKIVGHAGA